MPSFSTETCPLRKKYSLWFTILKLALLFICLAFPFMAGNYYLRFAIVLFIYIIVSIGYDISSGYCGMLTLSAAAIFGAGAYASAITVTTLKMPFLVGMLVAMVVTGLISFLISLPAYKVKGNYLALISLGILEIVQRILNDWTSLTHGAAGFFLPPWSIFGMNLTDYAKYYVIFFFLILIMLFEWGLIKSHWGRDFIAVKNDEIAASGVGINNRKFKVIALLISSMIIGVAGSLYASYSEFISPDTFGFYLTIFILLTVVIGGTGTLSGPAIGVTIVMIIPEFFNASPDLKQIVFGGLLIILTQVMPGGITGRIKERFRAIDDNRHIENLGDRPPISFEKYRVNADGPENILEVKNLTRRFGGLTAVGNLDLEVKRGTVHSLIGPNGAGKTTTVNLITGIDKPSEGSVIFNGEDITGMEPFDLVKRGIARTYQHVRLFKDLRVIDNVAMGGRIYYTYGLAGAIFHSRKKRKEEKEAYLEAYDCLKLIGLESKSNFDPGSLSTGQQKLVEIARALCEKPKLMVLDEPCAGLNETEVEELSEIIKKIRDVGITVLMIEHHMSIVMGISDYITVIDYGKKIAEGTTAEVSVDPVVRKAYLGEEVTAC
ncbi:branched-chain amino acid ABC transporter ATP-binding protein/permease [Desulfotruncus alcoholivorax]|uniref:branched-chain amino acid ABC transporter ATP-binding protein/permease n=1 Tax=Desulfotruncus alcoholivorax TaxID=265477 RepID=UPI0004838314|nr:branched-chain amino acid ABC transporter ATP-binding protein/permease [Desulfotruncus alcoholivorax]